MLYLVLAYRKEIRQLFKKNESRFVTRIIVVSNCNSYTYSNTIKSRIYNNGYFFTKHEKINKVLNIKSYFCKPYHSWEKGTVENINGLIRRFFPKGTNFAIYQKRS